MLPADPRAAGLEPAPMNKRPFALALSALAVVATLGLPLTTAAQAWPSKQTVIL